MSDKVQMMLVAECVPESMEPLTKALERFDISCVLITPPGWQSGTGSPEGFESAELPALDQTQCQALVSLIQNSNAAAIVANDAALAVAVRADGCHLDHTEALEETYRNARNLLGTGAIVGAMPGATRHMAMALAEASADYIGYAIKNEDGDIGLECVAWWAEIFESPVVAFTDGGLAICKQAIEFGPPDFLAMPLLTGNGIGHLAGIAELIEQSGQLPIATKDAK
jgi:hypothetical protein